MKIEEKQGQSTRYTLVDALRGIAALGVVLFHARHHTVMALVYEKHTTDGLEALFHAGALGVPVFFILSGFVIAHSLRSNSLSAKDVGGFMLRRQLRLDPAFWCSILLMLSLLFAELYILKLPSNPMPGWRNLAANFLYLQDVLKLPKDQKILTVAWTLCLEIQFYIFFLLLLVIGKNGKRINPKYSVTHLSFGLVFITGILCLLMRPFYVDAAWFFSHWYYFVLGTLAYYTWQNFVPSKYFYGFSTLFFVIAVVSNSEGMNKNLTYMSMFSGLATAWVLYAAGTTNRMSQWGNNKVLLYLGKISYSWYLTHLFVFYIVLRGAYKATGENAVMAYIWMAVAILCSVGFAHIFYLAIERPSLKLTERFKVAKPQPKPAPAENLTAADSAPALVADA